MNPSPLADADLHALVDGVLPPSRAAALEAQLAAQPEAAARVAAWRAQPHALRARFDAVLDEPVPAVLQQANRRPPRRWPAAAAVGWLALGALLGWGGRGWWPADRAAAVISLPREAAVAHAVYAPEVRHPVEVTAAEHAHLVAWLSKRLGTKLSVPVLEDQGFRLVGGRLLPSAAGGPVAQFMYQDAGGQRLTLYVRNDAQSPHDTAFRFAREGGVSVFYWVDGHLGYALSGELERAALLRIADVVYRQLNP
jgi:anti-sigma factor RsiW